MEKLYRRIWLSIALGAVLSAAAWANVDFELPLEPLRMQERQPEISRFVSRLIEELHYAEPRLDNSLSSTILDRYLDLLDGNRMYFLAGDVSSFSRYRYELDDRARSGELGPVFEIFNVFRERARTRLDHALGLLETEPDFTVDESFRFDRRDLAWPVTEQDMAELWRLKVKSDALSLVLADEPWPAVVKTLTERYERSYERIAELTSEDVFESFMNTVAQAADPHSSYLSPHRSEEERIRMSLSYEGIGARLQLEDEHAEIVAIMPGGPAHIDGELGPEDRITAIGEGSEGAFVHVVGWRLEDVVELIRGPSGTSVRLRILPAGATPGSPEKVVTLVRDKVKDEERAAKSDVIDVDIDGRSYRIGIIEVPSFYQDFEARRRGDADFTSTSRDVARLIRDLETDNVDGIVMDLRQNGGGHLSEATELSGLFIDRGPVVQVRETGREPLVLDDPMPSTVYDGPLAVLVDRYSASASEIFAAAIQDYERGIIIGQQTFGKGSVQSPFDLDQIMRGEDNGQLTLTIGKFYRVTGDSTQNRGVIPDIELPSLVPAEEVGESTVDGALPWDRIRPAAYDARPSLDTAIAALASDHRVWASSSPDFEYLMGNVETVRSTRTRTTVSLSLERRRAEVERQRAERLQLENRRREALGLAPIESLEELEQSASSERIQLELAARVVADLAHGYGEDTAAP